MKKVLLTSFLMMFVCTVAFAVDFAPPVLRLNAPAVIQYDFDGSALKIPVTVSGSPAGTLFCVFTKDKAESIGEVRNGFLGWHYVNKVDTSVYISTLIPLDVGQNTVEWNGKGEGGGMVPSGEYTYYMWAYDNTNLKSYASKHVETITHNLGAQVHIQEKGETGLPLARPFIRYRENTTGYTGKWVIGSDPEDATMKETCMIYFGEGWSINRVVVPVPTNHSQVFASGWLSASVGIGKGVFRFNWVPNGDATPVTSWGDNGYSGIGDTADDFSGPCTDDTYLYWINQTYHDYNESQPMSELISFSIEDGTLEQRKEMIDWWCSSADLAGDGQLNGGPNGLMQRNGYLFMCSHSSCLVQMVDPNIEDYYEGVKYSNKNGDYVLDHHFFTDSSKPWVCNDYKTPPFWTSFAADANNFAAGPLYDLGAVSFGLIAPDGTGIANFAFAGETASRKYYLNPVDYGSPYDGLYSDNTSSVSKDDNPNQTVIPGLKWIGHDSIKGILTSNPVAVDEAPAAFSVAQNSPNPFNPTTTISFSVPEAGNVSIDVFNVAGQKVDTVASEFMSAGSHSVTWNASGLSAGVYFYTVKAGGFAKTIKMTLLK